MAARRVIWLEGGVSQLSAKANKLIGGVWLIENM